jgi:hypothetical protein
VKLPGAEHAFIDDRKLVAYCLNPAHPRGRNKARVFSSALGFTESSAPILRAALIEAARTRDAVPAEDDEHGQRFAIEFPMTGPRGSAIVRSIWIIRAGEDFPRLVSCYILST